MLQNSKFLNNYAMFLHKYISNFFDRSSAIFPELTGSAKLRLVALHDGECSFLWPYIELMKGYMELQEPASLRGESYFGSHEKQKGSYCYFL